MNFNQITDQGEEKAAKEQKHVSEKRAGTSNEMCAPLKGRQRSQMERHLFDQKNTCVGVKHS